MKEIIYKDIEIKNTMHQIEIKSIVGKKLYEHCAWDYIHNYLSRFFSTYLWFDCRYKDGRKKFKKHLDEKIDEEEKHLEKLKFCRILCTRNKIKIVE